MALVLEPSNANSSSIAERPAPEPQRITLADPGARWGGRGAIPRALLKSRPRELLRPCLRKLALHDAEGHDLHVTTATPLRIVAGLIVRGKTASRQASLSIPIHASRDVEQGGPRLTTSPGREVHFASSTATIAIQNSGPGVLEVQEYSMTGPGGMVPYPSIDDFVIDGCAGIPCRPEALMICPMDAPILIRVHYQNNDSSLQDIAELRISSNDPLEPVHVLLLSSD